MSSTRCSACTCSMPSPSTRPGVVLGVPRAPRVGAGRSRRDARDRGVAGLAPRHADVGASGAVEPHRRRDCYRLVRAARRSRGAPFQACVCGSPAGRGGRRVVAIVVLAVKVDSLRGQLNEAHQAGPPAMAIAFDHAAKAPGAREVGLRKSACRRDARAGGAPPRRRRLSERRPPRECCPRARPISCGPSPARPRWPRVVSAGVLGPDPQALAFHASGPVCSFVVTVEKTGGCCCVLAQPAGRDGRRSLNGGTTAIRRVRAYPVLRRAL